mmetsp:Transcript_13765/g.24572  ORF Transcript_13765/g.24572 Transcript_13765/m.24572 type:complete len:83 (-) Transcript_13765:400-648(-)
MLREHSDFRCAFRELPEATAHCHISLCTGLIDPSGTYGQGHRSRNRSLEALIPVSSPHASHWILICVGGPVGLSRFDLCWDT